MDGDQQLLSQRQAHQHHALRLHPPRAELHGRRVLRRHIRPLRAHMRVRDQAPLAQDEQGARAQQRHMPLSASGRRRRLHRQRQHGQHGADHRQRRDGRDWHRVIA